MEFRTISAVDVRGKAVLVREDLNVPLRDGEVADDTRIVAALDTLRWLRDRGARTIVISHLGRPDGKVVPSLSLAPVATVLAEKLGSPVSFATDCVGPVARAAVDALRDGDVVLLENLRFHPEEEADDPAFARELASLATIYVNDAFGTAHRAHASTEGVAHDLPAYAGFLMERELDALDELMADPRMPFVCAIGGAKVKDKIGFFTSMLDRVSSFVIGGGMANTFLAAQGIAIGRSLHDDDLGPARAIIAAAAQRQVPLHLPVDAVVAPAFDADDKAETVALRAVGDRMILDIGPATAAAYAGVITLARTIVFNGPMGVYEKPAYREGTRAVLAAIAAATEDGATSVVGGGDAAAAAQMLGFAGAVTHVSTGGGATLEFLEGETLPGVAALEAAASA
jgi:phosphoglycerate kinase